MMSSGITVDQGERFFPNPWLCKELEDFNVFENGPNSVSEKMKLRGGSLLNQLLQSTTTTTTSQGGNEDYSVYTGKSGVILTLWKVSRIIPELSVKGSRIDLMLRSFVDLVASGRPLKGNRFTFLCGDAGPLATAFLITEDEKLKMEFVRRLLRLQDLVVPHRGKDGTPIPNELLYGRAGYLYCLLLLSKMRRKEGTPWVTGAVITNLVNYIIEEGLRHQHEKDRPLHFEWHEKIYLGAAHGYVGILYMLLKARDYMKDEHITKVKETLDWVLSQRFPSGNLRSSVGSKEDKLVHWCHGASGAIFLFLEAAKHFPEESDRYLGAALECGEVVWTRGILKRSYSICHGTAGNAYSLLALYKHTKDMKWLKRSCFFVEFCLTWGKHNIREPDRPHSLFEGLAGTVYALHEFHNFLSSGESSGSTPKFPAFELD